MIDNNALFKLSYGLYVLSARCDGNDNACIVNTVFQITDSPKTVAVAVNKKNYTHDLILLSERFNVSAISVSADFALFKRFGFSSGRDTDKFADFDGAERAENGIMRLSKASNAYICVKVTKCVDCGTHTLFIGEVTDAKMLSDEKSVTYNYYFEYIKSKPEGKQNKTKGFICKICGYVYEGEELPEDFVCPICKHGASDFEKL